MNSNQAEPFSDLKDLEQLAIRHAFDLPEKKTKDVYWKGVGFTLNDQQFVVQIGEVMEILPVPSVTPLPGVHSWAKGVANVRGRLLPIIDLGEFLDGQAREKLSKNRILVIQQDDLSAGLIVDEVQGMMQFSTGNHRETLPEDLSEPSRVFSTGHYQQDRNYVVFSTARLASNERFLRAAREQ